jgi:hypothetical protein
LETSRAEIVLSQAKMERERKEKIKREMDEKESEWNVTSQKSVNQTPYSNKHQ